MRACVSRNWVALEPADLVAVSEALAPAMLNAQTIDDAIESIIEQLCDDDRLEEVFASDEELSALLRSTFMRTEAPATD